MVVLYKFMLIDIEIDLFIDDFVNRWGNESGG